MGKLLEDYEIQLVEPGCRPGTGRWGAVAIPDTDISEVFPYLNALLPEASYDNDDKILVWEEEGQQYALRPREIRLGHVEDLAQARVILSRLVDRINKVWEERGKITPRFTRRKLAAVIDLFKLLPGTNCRQCGYPSCMAFAAELRKGKVRAESCPPLSLPEYRKRCEEIARLTAVD